MQFLSVEFLAGLGAAFLLYWMIPRRNWQNGILLTASLGMALSLGANVLAVLTVSTCLEWLIARRMGRAGKRGRSLLLWASIALNVSQLIVFKYARFFVPEMSRLFPQAGHGIGAWDVLMPAGLSFWTLQKMTLTLDVYHRRRAPETGFLRCLLFAGFFPTLLSGPIERSRNLLPQFGKLRTWDVTRFSEGVWLFAFGAFQKAVIADNVGAVADSLLKPGHTGAAVLVGMWAYALQIYADFAGYSSIARGCARLFGIDIMQNFMAPYLARNLSDFWKHWHISLSGWLNEYVYTPVSMRFRQWGTASMVLAIWATFTLSGLWHGTGWTFFAYGCLHALGITVFLLSKGLRKSLKARLRDPAWLEWAAVAITFHWVCMAYVFFRAPDIAAAASQIASLFQGGWNPLDVPADWGVLGCSAFAVFGMQAMMQREREVFWAFRRPLWFRVALYLALAFLLLRFYAPSDRFIYTQF